MIRLFAPCIFQFLLAALSLGAVNITGIVDKTKYDNTATFFVNPDAAAASTTATLDGAPVAVGANVTVTAVSYHEVRAESRDAGGAVLSSQLVRFIVRNTARGGSEDGIPSHTPLKSVNDAPSAFAGGVLKVVAPQAWPTGLPLPVAAVLRNGAGEGLRLNGTVYLSGLPHTPLQLRRGWGSVLGTAQTNAGVMELGAKVNGLSANRQVSIESGVAYTAVSGTISSDTTWPANSRIQITSTLTIAAGAKLTVGAGSIVLINTGTSTNGSAAEIVVNGRLQIDGADGNPVVFAPDSATGKWGGIELPVATSMVNATHTIFTGSGEDETWFSTHSGYSTHRVQQALFLISGSGSGTAVGAQIHLNDCFSFDLAGQQMNSKTNTWIDLQRTLMQRAVTCGELNGSKVTIDRSALLEFPGETEVFQDADDDAIYLTNGDLSITNTVIGITKDDGVDSGGNGGDNPFTAAADVTPLLSQNNWYEGTFHEGNSLSGTRNVTFSGCVFFNCGQGVEVGYSSNATADGPNALIDGCLFVGNMVGARWGDNYGSGYEYNGTGEVKNSILLHSKYRDLFSGQWHPTQANAWIYQTLATNSFGRAYFNVHDNYVSQPDPAHHPLNTAWDPAVHGALLEPFMPVPGSAVGVGVSTYQLAQSDPADYPGTFTIRLSTFSSKTVSVDWRIVGKLDPLSDNESIIGAGTLTFLPGETAKVISAMVASPVVYKLMHVALSNPVNAEITGENYYIKPPIDPLPIKRGTSGWRYRETRSEPPADWKTLNFDDTGAEWLNATLPAGFGGSATLNTTVNGGSSSDRTKAFYFRRKFSVTDPSKIGAVTLLLRRDDAAVAWLNGDSTPVGVSADAAFNGPYSYAMTGVPNATDVSTYFAYSIPASKLVTGENILAIEVHQTSLTSSDIYLDAELSVAPQVPLELFYTKSNGLPILWWFDPAAVLERSTDLIEWELAPAGSSPARVAPAGQREFFRLRK